MHNGISKFDPVEPIPHVKRRKPYAHKTNPKAAELNGDTEFPETFRDKQSPLTLNKNSWPLQVPISPKR